MKLLLLACVLAAGTARANYTLNLTTQGSGSVFANPTNTSYPSGVTVTLTATPGAGWYFVDWSGDASASTNPLNVVMNANLAITANFLELPVYSLALATNGEGTITLNPAGGNYPSNTTVAVTATPAIGWIFTGWSGGTNTTVNPVSVALNTNGSLAGTFAELPAITTQPVSVTNETGSTVSFSAQAVGTALDYQWFFSGGPLPGATSSQLTLADVSSLQAGTYWIVATNNYGSVTSSVVSLVLTNIGGSTNVVITPNEASLVAAINQGGWVSLGFNGTVTLTNTIDITNSVILDGQNVAVTISGGGAVQLFSVAPGVSLSITNVTLANGSLGSSSYACGGAISNNAGTVTLVDCFFTNNVVRTLAPLGDGIAQGGAIDNESGTLFLYDSTFSGNSAVSGETYGANNAINGGAISSTNGTVVVFGCNFNGNTVVGTSGGLTTYGGAIFQASGSLSMANTTFVSNQSVGGTGTEFGGPTPSSGGALGIIAGKAVAYNCQFLNNLTQAGTADDGSDSAQGGAVYSSATLIIESNTFAGNQAQVGYSPIHGSDGQGGAIYNAGLIAINHSAFYSNSVQGSTAASYSGVMDNGGDGLGGAIFNASLLYATNCTIALNSALAGSGSAAGFGPDSPITDNGAAIGGGLYNSLNTTSVLMNVTIASNYCVISGPGYTGTNGFAAGVEIANTNGVLHLHNSLIAYGGTNGNAYGPVIDDGFNISSDGTTVFSSGSSYNNTDPQLGPLANYGTTWCMAPLSTSPAIDNADPNDFPSTDQRGFFRPVGAGPDMGAFEYGSYVPGSIPSLTITTSAGNAIVSFPANPPGLYYLQSSTNLFNWINISTNGPFAVGTNVLQTTSMLGINQRYFRVLLETNN